MPTSSCRNRIDVLLVGQDKKYVFGFWLLALGQDTPV
jgi:hypothetical protein